MNLLYRIALLLFLLSAPHLRAVAQCNASTSVSISDALADFDARQPLAIDADITYCVNTNELSGFTGLAEFTTDLPAYPFRATLQEVGGTAVVLDALGDQTNVFGDALYTLRFEALGNGTADVTFTAAGQTAVYTVVVGSGLPVVWQAPLRATRDKDELLLDWSVSAQVDVSHYVLEAATDGDFQPVGEQLAVPGTGEVAYSFRITAPQGLTYYRVRQLDLDGQSSLSNTVLVRGVTPAVYPNPATEVLYVSPEVGLDRPRLVDASGRSFWPVVSGSAVSLAGVVPGVYMLFARVGGAGVRVVVY